MMTKNKGESYLQYVERATQALSNNSIGYDEWCQAILGETVYSDENLRRCFVFFEKFINRLDVEEIKELNDEHRVEEIQAAKEELIKERKKLQTVNLEAQEYYRTIGRNELFNEKIQQAIEKLEPVKCKTVPYSYPIETTGLLILSDQHYDSNFELKGLFGEVVNKYNTDIFKDRMWYLLGQMENDRFEYDKLVVVSCGDALEGMLRMTSLQKLKGNVIDSAIEFAEFMSQWLVEASNRLGVPIIFQLISGNHDIVRNLTQKLEFPEETLAKVIHEFIRLRIKDCKAIKIEPYSDVYYTTIHGSNLMFVHDCDTELLNYLENLYNIEIDTMYGGHLHRNETKPMGVGVMGDREVVRVPSVCGTDPFAKSIKKHSRAGAYFALYSDNGRELSKTYYLN